jgi:hypothetical protein
MELTWLCYYCLDIQGVSDAVFVPGFFLVGLSDE